MLHVHSDNFMSIISTSWRLDVVASSSAVCMLKGPPNCRGSAKQATHQSGAQGTASPCNVLQPLRRPTHRRASSVRPSQYGALSKTKQTLHPRLDTFVSACNHLALDAPSTCPLHSASDGSNFVTSSNAPIARSDHFHFSCPSSISLPFTHDMEPIQLLDPLPRRPNTSHTPRLSTATPPKTTSPVTEFWTDNAALRYLSLTNVLSDAAARLAGSIRNTRSTQ
jgi:hypothetical protein